MATRMVRMVTTSLIDVGQVAARIEAAQIVKLFQPHVPSAVEDAARSAGAVPCLLPPWHLCSVGAVSPLAPREVADRTGLLAQASRQRARQLSCCPRTAASALPMGPYAHDELVMTSLYMPRATLSACHFFATHCAWHLWRTHMCLLRTPPLLLAAHQLGWQDGVTGARKGERWAARCDR
jgi:hypothetical protein